MKVGDWVIYKQTSIGICKGVGVIIRKANSSKELGINFLVYWPSEHPLHQRRWEKEKNMEVIQ